MAVRTRRVTAATYLPLTLQEAKDHLRITLVDTGQDALITALISAATRELEDKIQRTLCETSWIATFDDFGDALKLPMAPVLSVTSLQYYDANGVLQTLAGSEYTVDTISEPGFVVPSPIADGFPEAQVGRVNAVAVTYKAGYVASPANQLAAAAAVPAPLKAWLLIRLATLFENREQVAFGGAPQEVPTLDCLIDAYWIREV